MKRRTAFCWIAILSLLIPAAAAFAQDQPAPTGAAPVQPAPVDRSGLSGALYRLSTLEDIPIVGIEGVQAPQAEAAPGAPADGTAVPPADGAAAPGMAAPAMMTYGSVEDAIITSDGTLSHLLVNIDDVEGVEGGLYLAQLDHFDIQDTGISLNVSPQELTAIEDEENAAQQAGENAYLASEVTGYDVVGSDDESIGGIDDLVVNIEEGRVVYGALGRGGVLGIGQDLHAIPFEEMSLEPGEEQIRIQATDADFEEREGFPGDQWPSEVGGQN